MARSSVASDLGEGGAGTATIRQQSLLKQESV
jgi:hypothetical protein